METASKMAWFGLPARTSLSRLLRTLGGDGYLLGPSVSSRYEYLFVETQDGRLAKGGSRLSVRRTGGAPPGTSRVPTGRGRLLFRATPPFKASLSMHRHQAQRSAEASVRLSQVGLEGRRSARGRYWPLDAPRQIGLSRSAVSEGARVRSNH